MEVTSLKQAAAPARPGSVRLLRLASDERLIALIRRGHHGAFEALVHRYQQRLLAFCRHMLGSREDAEDILQDVFVAAFNAILADDRKINVRPWLYRIARNRSLNHLRRATPIGVDSMDAYFADHGQSVTERILQRESFRALVEDIGTLAETQRTALLLREIDALSYEQIAEAMETTVPSVKSLLVRARVALAEAAEARQLSCEEVRLELGEAAEGLAKVTPPARRHLRQCERCASFRKQLKRDERALAAILPVGLPALLYRLACAKLGSTTGAGGACAAGGSGAGTGVSASTGAGIAAGTSACAAGGLSTLGGIAGFGTGAAATKAVAGLAAAALLTAGAVAVEHDSHASRHLPASTITHSQPSGLTPPAPAPVSAAPVVVRSAAQPSAPANAHRVLPGHPRSRAANATGAHLHGKGARGAVSGTSAAAGHSTRAAATHRGKQSHGADAQTQGNAPLTGGHGAHAGAGTGQPSADAGASGQHAGESRARSSETEATAPGAAGPTGPASGASAGAEPGTTPTEGSPPGSHGSSPGAPEGPASLPSGPAGSGGTEAPPSTAPTTTTTSATATSAPATATATSSTSAAGATPGPVER